MARNKVGHREIGEMLNISPCTVSKVLNHDPVYRVSDETRELILKTAREQGYKPRRRHTGNIALVVAGDMQPAYQELHRLACAQAATHSYRMFLVNTPSMPTYRELSLSVNPLSADGVLLEGDFSDDVIAEMSSVLPTVLLDERPHDIPIDRIYTDWIALSGKLAAHLVNLGHTKIALIVWDLNHMISRANIEGYRSVLKSAHIEYDHTLIWEKEGRKLSDVVEEIIRHPSSPTAIIACSQEEHLPILCSLSCFGIQVPRDMSYVGWDNMFFSGLSAFPEITCLNGFYQHLADAGMTRLFARIKNKYLPAQDIQVDIEVRQGGTCGKVPSVNDVVSSGCGEGV